MLREFGIIIGASGICHRSRDSVVGGHHHQCDLKPTAATYQQGHPEMAHRPLLLAAVPPARFLDFRTSHQPHTCLSAITGIEPSSRHSQ